MQDVRERGEGAAADARRCASQTGTSTATATSRLACAWEEVQTEFLRELLEADALKQEVVHGSCAAAAAVEDAEDAAGDAAGDAACGALEEGPDADDGVGEEEDRGNESEEEEHGPGEVRVCIVGCRLPPPEQQCTPRPS